MSANYDTYESAGCALWVCICGGMNWGIYHRDQETSDDFCSCCRMNTKFVEGQYTLVAVKRA